MSITLFTTDLISGDKYLFRDENIDVFQIEDDSELYNYLYDEKKPCFRTVDGDSHLYKIKSEQVYAIKCIDKYTYGGFDRPNCNSGKSDYISILIRKLLSLNEDKNLNKINLILHHQDIDVCAFSIKSCSINEYFSKGCLWINSDAIKERLLTPDVVELLEEHNINVNIALFTHSSGLFSNILLSNSITSEKIDEIFANV